jgi:hypothetical protein
MPIYQCLLKWDQALERSPNMWRNFKVICYVFTNKQTCFQDGSQVKGTEWGSETTGCGFEMPPSLKSLVISLKTLPRFFFTVLNNLTSPRRVTFLGRPTLGMFQHYLWCCTSSKLNEFIEDGEKESWQGFKRNYQWFEWRRCCSCPPKD